jgi:hypothetical protein
MNYGCDKPKNKVGDRFLAIPFRILAWTDFTAEKEGGREQV